MGAEKSDNRFITILNWKKYNPRGDVKKSSWYRCEHQIPFDENFADFEHLELLFYYFLLSYASMNNTGSFRFTVSRFAGMFRLPEEIIESAVAKLGGACLSLKSPILVVTAGPPSAEELARYMGDGSEGEDEDVEARSADVTPPDRKRSPTKRHDTVHSEDPPPAVFDFPKLIRTYPRRDKRFVKRGWEEEAIQSLVKEIRTPEEFAALERALKNFTHFHKTVSGTKERYIPTFKTFFTERKLWVLVSTEGKKVEDTGKPCKPTVPEGCTVAICFAHKAHELCETRLADHGLVNSC